MLGLLLIYFIWKHYADLAVLNNKNKWGYGILGVVTYYAGTIVGGVAIAVIDLVGGTHLVDETNNLILGLFSLPFGLLFTWGLYRILKNKWENNKIQVGDSLDHDLLESNKEE